MSLSKDKKSEDHLSKEEMTAALEDLYEEVLSAADRGESFDSVEKNVLNRVLSLGRKLMCSFVDQVGPGDLGESIVLNDGRDVVRLEEQREKRIVSVFGNIFFNRFAYAEREKQKIEFIPSDARMRLPESDYSYTVQDLAQKLAVDMPYSRVKEVFKDFLRVKVGIDSLERINQSMSQYVPEFRDKRKEPLSETEGEILVVQADGKGVPVIHEAVQEPFGQKRTGPKKGCKKMATVGCVYTVDAKRRTAEEVVESLWGGKDRGEEDEEEPHAVNKRVMATLTTHEGELEEVRSKDAVFRWVARELRKRIGDRKIVVRLLDGDPFLRESSQKWFDFGEDIAVVDVLDWVHVAGYLWDASHLFHQAGSPESSAFTRKRMSMLLEGNARGLISGIRQMGTKSKWDDKKLEQLESICAYLENNLDRMKYDEYLLQGFPIASGVIEGACRYVVKDRMERTGTRWSESGAVAMLALRTTRINDDWERYQKYYKRKESKRLYDAKFELKQVVWPVSV